MVKELLHGVQEVERCAIHLPAHSQGDSNYSCPTPLPPACAVKATSEKACTVKATHRNRQHEGP